MSYHASKQYLYQLILSQLLNDGHSVAAEYLSEYVDVPFDPTITTDRLSVLVNEGLSLEQSRGFFDPKVTTSLPDVAIPQDSSEIPPIIPQLPPYDSRYHSPHKEACRCVSFSNDGTWAASGSADMSVKLIDVSKASTKTRDSSTSSNPVVKTFFGHTDYINTLSFHPFAPFLASGSRDGLVSLFDIGKSLGGKNSFSTCSLDHNVRSIAWFPTGDWLVAATESPVLKFLNISTDASFTTFSPRGNNHFNGPILCTSINQHLDQVFAGSADRTLRVFDPRLMNITSSLSFNGKVYDVATSPMGRYVAVTLSTGQMIVYDCRMIGKDKQLMTMDMGSPKHRSSVSWFPGSSFILVANGSSKDLRVVNTLNNSVSEWSTGHQGVVRDVSVSSNGHVTTASEDKRVRLYFKVRI
ncbi:hypothetical protein GEMRC1_003624 [Eukaryota sp. GEM-RC1]